MASRQRHCLWLLDLTANALVADRAGNLPAVSVSEADDLQAAVYEGVALTIWTASHYELSTSRFEATFQNKIISAMRFGFGGHLEKAASK